MSAGSPLVSFEPEKKQESPRFDLSALAWRAGGHFKLCSLVTKRSKEIMIGSPRLTEFRAKSPINNALKEFEEGRILLLTPEEARRRLLGGSAEPEAPDEEK